LLGNISPDLQLHVLAQTENPRFVVADTMDLWINNTRDQLLKVISKVNMLTLNDSEARLLTGEYNLKKCASIIREMGPDYVVIKKGEHGAILFSEKDIFLVPAYPVDIVNDPTGAGDSFAGGFMGFLAERGEVDERTVKLSMLYGAVVASFGVESFTLDNLAALDRGKIESRLAKLKAMMTV
jgi:sugar/nucleoside kinase (ribokinase family)